MPSGTVRAVQERPLTVHRVGQWAAGGKAVNFRAAVKRQRHLWAVTVKCVSRDHSRVFVKFGDGCTAWVPVDDLLEG